MPTKRIRLIKVSTGCYMCGRFRIEKVNGCWYVLGARVPATLLGQRYATRGGAYVAVRAVVQAAEGRAADAA